MDRDVRERDEHRARIGERTVSEHHPEITAGAGWVGWRITTRQEGCAERQGEKNGKE
jgi:hypothetical protein